AGGRGRHRRPVEADSEGLALEASKEPALEAIAKWVDSEHLPRLHLCARRNLRQRIGEDSAGQHRGTLALQRSNAVAIGTALHRHTHELPARLRLAACKVRARLYLPWLGKIERQ